MKCYLSTPLFLVSFAFFISCTEDQDPNLKARKIQFRINIPNQPSALQSGEPASVSLSIQNFSGKSILSDYDFKLIADGNGYITEPLELPDGGYQLSDVLVHDSGGNVMAATPKKGSRFASRVSGPLGYVFKVGETELAELSVEAMPVMKHVAKDFGYKAFNSRKPHPFDITVVVFENSAWVPSEATAVVTSPTGEAQSFKITKGESTIRFKGDLTLSYILTVYREGYTPDSRTLDYEYARQNGIRVELESVPDRISIMSESVYDTYDFTLFVQELSHFHVNWGDGATSEKTATGSISFGHQYEVVGSPASAVVTGDLGKIKSFYKGSHYVDGCDLLGLTGVENIYLDLLASPIDLRNAAELKTLYIGTGYYDLILPPTHNLTNINVGYASNNVDEIISNVYINTVQKGLRGGTLAMEYVTNAASASSLAILQRLEQDYGWTVLYSVRQ